MNPTRLLSLDTELTAAVIDPTRRREAIMELVVDELTLDPGGQLDVGAIGVKQGLGVLILSGFLCREIAIADRVSADLAGPEDLVSVGETEASDDLFLARTSHVALCSTRLAVLDGAFSARVSRWPEVLLALVGRAGRLGDRSAHTRAIARSPAIDERLLLSMWHWASWWSSVVTDGVRLAVPLSHERLARLIGATRPTITAAIGRLRRAGYLEQREDGLWLLCNPANGGVALAGNGSPLGAAQLRVPPRLAARARVRSSRDQRMTNRSDLSARLSEQQEQLRLAADRHVAQLVRLRNHADKLRATAELSELARQARNSHDGRETT
jgi:CRP-like cAMP-binding protein